MEETLSILIADDNIGIADYIKGFLASNLKFRIIGIARDKKEEIDFIINFSPDVVITDLKKGNSWSGLDIIKEVQNNCEKAPVFFIISASAISYIDEMRKLDIRYYLNKPFDVEDVLGVLNRIYDDFFPKQIIEINERNEIETNDYNFFNKLRNLIKRKIGR